ncbi:hypothetical protein A6R68_02549, partial [Neotoma lepida]
KLIVTEVADVVSEEWKDHVVHNSDGNDKQDFSMEQSFLTYSIMPLLLNITLPWWLVSKKASRIHKLCNLSKEDHICQNIRKTSNKDSKKCRTNASKIHH